MGASERSVKWEIGCVLVLFSADHSRSFEAR